MNTQAELQAEISWLEDQGFIIGNKVKNQLNPVYLLPQIQQYLDLSKPELGLVKSYLFDMVCQGKLFCIDGVNFHKTGFTLGITLRGTRRGYFKIDISEVLTLI
jgi:hypothetical protein